MPDTTQVTNSIANTSTAVSAATGTAGAAMSIAETLTDWVAGNALIITLSCTVLSLLVGLIFHIVNARMTYFRDQRNEQIQVNRNKLQRAQMISSWQAEGKTQEEIEQILKLAGL